MVKLTEKRFADYFRVQPGTGMGYWVATAYLNDGRIIPRVVVTGDKIARVRNYESIPFS